MAPDKIYIQNYRSGNFTDFGAYYELKDGTVLDAEFHVKTQKHESIIANIEYIRKDALLEWAKEELDNTSILRSETIETLQKVIDKLNSM